MILHTAPVPAERAVLGAMLLSGPSTETAAAALRASDFALPSHQVIFDAIVDLWRRGLDPDPVALVDHSRRAGTPIEALGLLSLQAEAPSTAVGTHHLATVIEYAARRRLVALGADLVARAQDETQPVGTSVEVARAELSMVDAPSAVVAEVHRAADFAWALDPPTSWVVPGLLDQEDRCIIVAGEGHGKSMVSRWLAVATSQGLSPFALRPCPPQRALIVDLENPARTIRRTLRPMFSAVAGRDEYDGERCWMWHRPGGVDLRSRSGAAELEAAVRAASPRLVCLGPLYKTYRSGDNGHDSAAEVAAVFDSLRTRYGFALVLEHHAPLAQAGQRHLRPFGSLLWSQWPEIGLTLAPVGDSVRRLKVGFYRGCRDERAWPSEAGVSKAPILGEPVQGTCQQAEHAGSLRDVRGGLHGPAGRTVLHEELFSEARPQGGPGQHDSPPDIDRAEGDSSGLCARVGASGDARPAEVRLHDGAPAGDADPHRATSRSDGMGSPSQRSQGRQPNREPGDHQPREANGHGDLSSLSEGVLSPLRGYVCPCGSASVEYVGDHWRPGVVLDPFGGSGTTAVVATGHGRDAILIDIDERNAELARQRVGMFLNVETPEPAA